MIQALYSLIYRKASHLAPAGKRANSSDHIVYNYYLLGISIKRSLYANKFNAIKIVIRWPDTISNVELWMITNQKEITLQIKRRKWNWIAHTIRKDYKAVERMALDCNPLGSRARGRPRNTWKRTVLEEIAKEGKTWNEVKKLATNRDRWKYFLNALCSSRGDTGD